MKITNNKDLKFWYIYLKSVKDGDLPCINVELVKECKKAVREYTHRPVPVERIFDADIDGMTSVYPLPETIRTEQDAEEYFNDYEHIHYRPTYYDCTGQLFTSWYKIFKRHDHFWVYHRIARDC